jgi:hypothetical protein
VIGYLLANQFPSILLEWLNLFFFDFQVSVEYGLCEMLNSQAIRSGLSPKDGKWGFNISELEAILPAGTVDNTVEPVYKELPQWEESVASARARYANIFQALADKYPKENLLLVTHGMLHSLLHHLMNINPCHCIKNLFNSSGSN